MKPERASRLVQGWVRLYTRDLPVPIAARRSEEVAADLDDQIELERSRGTSDRHISFSILSRMIRGVLADLSWHRQIRTLKGDIMKPTLGTIAAMLAGSFGIAVIIFGEIDDAPGLVLFGLLIIGGALAFGLMPSLRSRSRVLGFILAAIALTAIGSGIAGWLEDTF